MLLNVTPAGHLERGRETHQHEHHSPFCKELQKSKSHSQPPHLQQIRTEQNENTNLRAQRSTGRVATILGVRAEYEKCVHSDFVCIPFFWEELGLGY